MADRRKWKLVPGTHTECSSGNCFRTKLKHVCGLIDFRYGDSCVACEDLHKAVRKILDQKNEKVQNNNQA